MKSKPLSLHDALKSASEGYANAKLDPDEFARFKTALAKLFEKIDASAGEENQKNVVAEFLKDAYYRDQNDINTKDKFKIDLVIHTGKSSQTPVGVIIETKNPVNAAEMVTAENLNAKALHQLVLYYFREKNSGNDEITHLIATNVSEWFIFDAAIFKSLFYENTELVAYFQKHAAKKLDDNSTSAFYEHVERFVDENVHKIAFTHFSLNDYKDADEDALIELYKILSPEHLLKLLFKNDSNTLNRKFYDELLYIIGLNEVGQNGKTRIERCKKGERQSGALIEEIITQLKTKDKIRHVKNAEQYGSTEEDRLVGVALELSITWINRILFLKLLEAQLLLYHQPDKSYSFLSRDNITSYIDLDELFFQVLALQRKDRSKDVAEKFANVPYLNSTLFTPTELEQDALFVGNLKNKPLQFFSQTVLIHQSNIKKKRTGNISSLEYLLAFLDAYDFGSESGEKVQKTDKPLINASVLGLIFEKINGYKDGSHFTSGFITMCMCREAIRKAVVQKFNEVKKWNSQNLNELYDKIDDAEEANAIVNSLKICDPAVGSGHFLVSALNEVIAIKHDLKILRDSSGKRLKEYDIQIVNDELAITDENGKPFVYHFKSSESQRVQETLFHEKQTIIENCLFGVDINPNSVAICRLRLWIELLKSAYYKNAAELETLPNIDINIKCGNSLVSRFPLDADLKKVLKGKHTIEKYRKAVDTYRNAKNKAEKLKMETLVADIKSSFRGELQLRLFGDGKEKENGKIYANAFEWRFEFPEVLNDSGEFIGFDVVIGNPPYKQLAANEVCLSHYKSNYQVAHGGKVNLYRLFFEKGILLLKNYGSFAYITPDTYFSSKSNFELRKFLVNNVRIQQITHYRESDNVFENVTQAVAILIAVRGGGKGVFTLRCTNSENLIDTNALCERDGFLFCADDSVMQRMKMAKYCFADVCDGYQGEVNVSTKKEFITTKQAPHSLPLIRGDHISNYSFAGSSEWCVPEATSRDHCKSTRVVFQEVVNAQVQKRVNGVLLTDCYCGHTTNYFVEKAGKYNLKTILGVLNSQAVNYFFKSINQTNHVPIGEILAVPFPEIDDKSAMQLERLVNEILAAKKADAAADTSKLESTIDKLVDELYGLT